jgi:1-acyl-sn-glycerol-3-phosphate acyltransferase
MLVRIVRFVRGLLMAVLFGVFFLGIIFGLFIVLPVIRVMDKFFGAEPDRMQRVLRILVAIWLLLLRLCRLLIATPSIGKPVDGPCVVVSNHPGLFDVLYLIRDIPRMSVMVKRSLAQRLPLGPIFRSAGYVLAPDFENISPLQSLEESAKQIKNGYKFLVFPEATRSPKGHMGKLNPGAFKIARMTQVPVQPVFIRNNPPFIPKEDKWYFPSFHVSHLQVEFWDPIPPPEAGNERECARKLETRYREALGLH